MNVTFVRREELAPGILQYWFRPERPVDFVPGQYVDLVLDGVENDPRGASRTFTLTSLPDEGEVSFVLKHFGLQSPYKHVLQNLAPGIAARINDAMGDLVLPKAPEQPLVYIAGGIGIASYVSMLRDLIARKEERPIFFYYRLRSRSEYIFRDLIESYPLQLKQIVYAPNDIRAQEIKDSTPPNALLYLSGSQTFVENLRTDLETLGTPRSQIVFDYYDGYAEL